VKYVEENNMEFPDEYDLWYRDVVLKNHGLIQRIYFFLKEGKNPKNPEACTRLSDKTIPQGWKVVYAKRNNYPFLKRI